MAPIEPSSASLADSISRSARPLRHAYELNPEMTIRPGMIARCGHVRTEDEGETAGDGGRDQLDPCMVCLHLDNAVGGWAR